MMDDENDEYVSMIDAIVAVSIRECVCRAVSKEVGVPYPDAKQYLHEMLDEIVAAEDNIRIWFEKNL